MRRIRNPVYGSTVPWVRIPPLPPVLYAFSAQSFTTPRGFAKRMIGLAGVVAEQIEVEPETQAYEVFEFLREGIIEMSQTDADCAGAVRGAGSADN